MEAKMAERADGHVPEFHEPAVPLDVVDHEVESFAAEVAADLPEGDALGMAEARVDYLLERIQQERKRANLLLAAAAARITIIQAKTEDEAAKYGHRIAYLEAQVRLNLPGDASHFSKLYGKKSLALPHGKVGYRAVAPTVEIKDQARAIYWAEQAGVEVNEKTTRTLGKSAVLDYIALAGELPDTDAIEYVGASEKFFVKAGE